MNIQAWALGSTMMILMAGCVAADKAATTPAVSAHATSAPSGSIPDAQPLNGWYLQGTSGSRLQPCGQSVQWRIGDKADLPERAKAFGLQDDTPVYVKLLARVSGASNDSGKKVDVVRVEQFGSPIPVRDCGMTGVVTPAPKS